MSKRFRYIAGIDEAGRGALSGPVIASCVCFKKKFSLSLKDSKKLTSRQRESFSLEIKRNSFYSFGIVSEKIIDRLNIFWATQLAFLKAIKNFLKGSGFRREEVLFIIDGPYFKYSSYNSRCIISADTKIKEVSAASILAKVLRDRIMINYDKKYPGWNFSKHKGYATKEHYHLLREKGISSIHRLSFNLGL